MQKSCDKQNEKTEMQSSFISLDDFLLWNFSLIAVVTKQTLRFNFKVDSKQFYKQVIWHFLMEIVHFMHIYVICSAQQQIFKTDLPVLIALVHRKNISHDSAFAKVFG